MMTVHCLNTVITQVSYYIQL